MTHKQNIAILSVFIILFSINQVLPLIKPLNNAPIVKELINKDQDGKIINYPKTSEYWVASPITIDEANTGVSDWATMKGLYNWISGFGTINDPYLIENVTINGGYSQSCITIKNSINKYFTIKNCTLFKAGNVNPAIITEAGIKLINTNNGSLINNNCSDNNRNGILLIDSNHNQLFGNIASRQPQTYSGIYLNNSDWNDIQHNIAQKNGRGITLYKSEYNLLQYNNFTYNNHNNPFGLSLETSNHNHIAQNNFSFNTFEGVFLSSSVNNTITSNLISNNGLRGIYMTSSSSNNITWNEIIYNANGICLSLSTLNSIYKNTLQFNTQNGIQLLSSSINNIIEYNGIYDNSLNGILVDSSNSNYISSNLISLNGNNGIKISQSKFIEIFLNEIYSHSSITYASGILIESSSSSIDVYHNDIYLNLVGIYITTNSKYIIMFENEIYHNDIGLYFNGCNNNTSRDNTITQSDVCGILIEGGGDITITLCNITFQMYGLMVAVSSRNNTIFRNNFINHTQSAIWLDASSEGNFIHQNYFYNTSLTHAIDDGIYNLWYNEEFGNYWDDYEGWDYNDDGIGDIPYDISGTANAKDIIPIWNDGLHLPQPFDVWVDNIELDESGFYNTTGDFMIKWTPSYLAQNYTLFIYKQMEDIDLGLIFIKIIEITGYTKTSYEFSDFEDGIYMINLIARNIHGSNAVSLFISVINEEEKEEEEEEEKIDWILIGIITTIIIGISVAGVILFLRIRKNRSWMKAIK